MAEFQNLILNLIPPYIAIMGRDFDELPDVMAELNEFITQQFNSFPDIYREKIENAAGRYKIYE